MRIYKYDVPRYGAFSVDMDDDEAQFMRLGYQGKQLVMWFLIDPDNGTCKTDFISAYTGDAVNMDYAEYLDTVYNPNTGLATHLFQAV